VRKIGVPEDVDQCEWWMVDGEWWMVDGGWWMTDAGRWMIMDNE